MQSSQHQSSATLSDTPAYLKLAEIRAFGTDTGRGNLLGIQPFMETTDYLSETAFAAKIGGYLAVASEQRWLGPRTIVVLPEMLGTWLIVADEDIGVTQAASITTALRLMARHHALGVFSRVLFAREKNRLAASIFRVKARRMAEIYTRVFGILAETYEVTVVAGSLVLPNPRVEDGVLQVGNGPLYNTTAVFRPDGKVHDTLVRKVVLIDREQPFVTAGLEQELPVFVTPAGRLGVLICADSWFPGLYKILEEGGAEMLAVPSYLAPDAAWEQAWGGYNGAAPPPDVDTTHVGQISEGQAWLTYALPRRLGATSMTHGLIVFLRGRLWDLGADGHTILRHGSEVHEAGHYDGAALINCWLG